MGSGVRAAVLPFVVAALGLGAAAASAHAQGPEAAPPVAVTQPPPDTQVDIFDVARKLFKKPPKDAAGAAAWDHTKLMLAIVPTFGYKPSTGFTIGAMSNLAKHFGDPETTRISSAVVGLSVLDEAADVVHREVRRVRQGQPVAPRRRQPVPVDFPGQLRPRHQHVARGHRQHEVHLRPRLRHRVVQADEERLRGRGFPFQFAHERAPRRRRRSRVGELRLRDLQQGERLRSGWPVLHRVQPEPDAGHTGQSDQRLARMACEFHVSALCPEPGRRRL